ncbi:hypothetical protein FRACA_10148 [Frankia canadensis]|uniref:Uncharacterized protein n=1 Tax=Frankia canadensis TaxID=1836972 RepID=A0A2I2KID1_9ACTN|nr:hypothetical protein FRACA_10148 [Frankia canadensis]SOU52679.1 hypothetical protein FRACA_10148 [Frankia canadensis]
MDVSNRPAEDRPEAGAGLIGVTGATGRLGGRVARRLAQLSAPWSPFRQG